MPRPKGSKNKKGRPALKKFICPACGEEFEANKNRKAIHCSFECKGISQSEKYKGKGNPFYGKSFKHTEKAKLKIGKAVIKRFDKIGRREVKEYNHPNGNKDYKGWREAVFARDNWTCQKCKAKSKVGKQVYLEAHHIKGWTKYPKLRFDIKNGITLCKNCHKIIHKKNL